MAGVFFGEAIGIATIALCAVALVANFAALHYDLLIRPDLTFYARTSTSWISITGALLLAASGPLIAVSRFMRHLELERRRAEDASIAKSSFLAMMSHELRTPMAGILGITDLLLEDELSPDQEERVARVAKSGRALLDMLNDLLDFSKIEANHLVLERIPFSLQEVITGVFELLQPLADEKNIALRLDQEPGLADALIGDPVRLRQIMINLMGNAIKFTAEGWVAVHISQTRTGGNSIMLKVRVSDTGIGIAPQQQAMLFQPFSQGDLATGRRYGGTGLGLAISRRLVELMGGTITYHPRDNRGSVFSFDVAVAENIEAPQTAAPGTTPRAAYAARSLRILVADDNETIRYLLDVMLRRWGHNVDLVIDGAAALNAVQAGGYDIVLMDMQMPGMDGVQATRRIRALSGAAARVPIIALTADMLADHRLEYLKAGASTVIGKPVDWMELAAELKRQCGPGASLSPTAPPEKTHEPPPMGAVVVLDESALSALSEDIGGAELGVLLGKFRKNLVEYGATLSRTVAAGDLATIKRTAHGLKGLCMQFGATRVGLIAKSMEQDDLTLPQIRDSLTALAEEIAAVEKYLDARGVSAAAS